MVLLKSFILIRYSAYNLNDGFEKLSSICLVEYGKPIVIRATITTQTCKVFETLQV